MDFWAHDDIDIREIRISDTNTSAYCIFIYIFRNQKKALLFTTPVDVDESLNSYINIRINLRLLTTKMSLFPLRQKKNRFGHLLNI